MKLQQLFLSASLLSLAFLPKAASAHQIETNYQVRLNNFEIQTVFSSGEAFPNAPVTVYSPDNPNQPILVGQTDQNGKFSFQPDLHKVGNWKVEIGKATDNHWDRLIVPVDKTGIEAQEISELTPPATTHHHDYFAYSFLLTVITLGIVFGTRKLGDRPHLDP